MEVQDLSPAHCILLAVHLASEANIKALHTFTATRLDALNPELVLRILLTYLPEAVDPREYLHYVDEVASRLFIDVDREDAEVNTAPVKDLSEDEAKKKVKKLGLMDIEAPHYPPHAPKDLLTKFLCHRAYRIDSETGLLSLVPRLVEPYLSRNPFIRTWYIAVVLPLLRMELEYYPDDGVVAMSLTEFEKIRGRQGVDLLLRKCQKLKDREEARKKICRDIKSLVGPWMYGHNERKRRRLTPADADLSEDLQDGGSEKAVEDASRSMRKVSLDGITADDYTGHDWEYMFGWMVHHAADDLSLIARAIDGWDGPSDIDLGGYEREGVQYLDESVQQKLELQYTQAAFASCYAVNADTLETIENAHSILARLAELLDFVPPPDLATSVDALPKIERHATKLDESASVSDLLPDALRRPEHPLTSPKVETYMLLQMMVYSAYQFDGLGYSLSLINVAKLHFYSTAEEQLAVLRKILHSLGKSGARRDDSQWTADRAKLLWLWNWGIDIDEDNPAEGPGVLGKIKKDTFEEELLKVFIDTSCYQLATQFYINQQETSPSLKGSDVERIVLDKVMEAYDNASNGNKQRGGMKKANDILLAFQFQFSDSQRFAEATALIAATHSLSFYSLTLQHGVPFQPVNIRVSHDPLSLVSKVLEQNPRSYTKLDDLIGIARNLVSAGVTEYDDDTKLEDMTPDDIALKRKDAERHVTFLAVEAALREDDFETAYSYIINRLTPSNTQLQLPANNSKQHKRQRSSRNHNRIGDDDISWRAAFLAGRYRPSSSTPPTLRRLEQRTELLSTALLLAPTSALTEILAAWRRCEEEMTSLQLSQQQAEQDFDDRADKRLSGGSSALPGNFTLSSEQPELVLNQKRREMGRMGSARGGNDETPLSMFDLTRNAAKAFSQNAFTGATSRENRGSGEFERGSGLEGSTGNLSEAEGERVRKRDMVANAVSGGLASGLGWVLGATPQGSQQR